MVGAPSLGLHAHHESEGCNFNDLPSTEFPLIAFRAAPSIRQQKARRLVRAGGQAVGGCLSETTRATQWRDHNICD